MCVDCYYKSNCIIIYLFKSLTFVELYLPGKCRSVTLKCLHFEVYHVCLTDPATIDNIQVIDLPIVDGMHPRPDFMPQAIPEDLAPRLLRLHGNPFVWWVGQFLKFLLRPQPHLQADLVATEKRLGFVNPIVG